MNFLKTLLESIEYNLLLAEGRDPVEVLHYKFQNKVPTEIIDKVISIDPTKKKSYSQWLLSKWDDEKGTILNGLKSGRIAKLFQHMQAHKDVQLQAYSTLKEPLNAFVPDVDTVLTKSDKPTTTLMNNGWVEEVDSKLANDFDIVFNEDDWLIAVPHTYEADCKLGENMRWCTAGGRSNFNGGERYYDNYLESDDDKYYVNFDLSKGESAYGKDYPYTRYQFHFRSHQFMDKNDEPVELYDIGMPDSAIEFYKSEGYSESDFEDLEIKIERYEEERYHVSYRINDDLYLCIEYDDDYEFIEPEDNTDFYLFSNDDDRDPVIWEEVPNPFSNENVVVASTDWFAVVRRQHAQSEDNAYLLAILSKSSWGMLNWDGDKIGKFLPVGDDKLFVVTADGTFTYFSDKGGKIPFDRVILKNCTKLFINEQCTNSDKEKWNQLFIEALWGDGNHTLFTFSDDKKLDCLIYKDKPINGESFILNERGLIEGEFRNYRVYDDSQYDDYNDNAYSRYQFEAKFDDGNILVRYDNPDLNKSDTKFNILKADTKQMLVKDWFDKYVAEGDNLYCVSYDESNTTIFRLIDKKTGEYVGVPYTNIKGLQHGTIAGVFFNNEQQMNNVHFIDSYNGKIKGVFQSYDTSSKPINNKIIVKTLDNINKCYDVETGEFCYPELSTYEPFGHVKGLYLCALNNAGTVVFDLRQEKIIASNVSEYTYNIDGKYHNKFTRLIKTNGNCNILDEENGVELLPNDVPTIEDFNEYYKLINYRTTTEEGQNYQDTYYIYNYEEGDFLINKNGINVTTELYNSGKICCSEGLVGIFFNQTGEFNHWRAYTEGTRNFREGDDLNDKEYTPPEVYQLYAKIFNNTNAYTMAESFKKILKRIDEANKLSHNDIYK